MVVVIKVFDFFRAKDVAASDKVCLGRVYPFGAADDLVTDSEEDDDPKTNSVLEEIFGGERASVL